MGDVTPVLRHEPRLEQQACGACDGMGYFMWGDALACYADPCVCDDGQENRPGIPLALDLRAAYG